MPEKITIGEIKEIIKAEEVSPSDLFGVESLMADSFVKGFVESAIKETQGKLRGEAEQRRRGEEGLDKSRKEWEDEKKPFGFSWFLPELLKHKKIDYTCLSFR